MDNFEEFDNRANFARSTVDVAPSPSTEGTSMVVKSGGGIKFPAPPFNCVVKSDAAVEIVRVTAITGDTFTIVRAQEGTNAINISRGMSVYNTTTKKVVDDIERYLVKPPRVYAGFGVNYGREEQYWEADALKFEQWGIRNIRVALATLFPTQALDNVTGGSLRRRCAEYFIERGFKVTWGWPGVAALTGPANLQRQIYQAAELQRRNIKLEYLTIGNEGELFLPSNQWNDFFYNITQVVAPAIKEVYTLAPILYTGFTREVIDYVNANGMGGLDHLGLNVYGYANTNSIDGILESGMPNVDLGYNSLGNRFSVSEFNVHPYGTTVLSDSVVVGKMQYFYDKYFKGKNIPHHFWDYGSGTGGGDARFVVINPDGTYKPWWDIFFTSGSHLRG